jgi:hypothetical protein
MRWPSRAARCRWLVYGGLLGGATAGIAAMTWMPGRSFSGPPPPLTAAERATADRVRRDVERLAGEIGERHLWRYSSLLAAAAAIEARFREAGYVVAEQRFTAGGRPVRNLEVERPGAGRAGDIVVVGAHYDTVPGCPGADDNASGVAMLLELAGRFAAAQPARTLRFVAFVNEEPPYFQTDEMGSLHYAARARARGERVVAMLSLESLGYYSEVEGSQRYPVPFALVYPRRADFIGFVGNVRSRALVRQVVGAFRRRAALASEAVAAPAWIPGIGWSDHWAFWRHGYRAVMVTDTALFRYPHYHQAADTPAQLDYVRLARLADGLAAVVAELAGVAVTSGADLNLW